MLNGTCHRDERPGGPNTATTARIETTIRDDLAQTGYLPLRDIQVAVREHEIHLRGAVPTYYQRQVARRIALQHSGGRGIVDELLVEDRLPQVPR